MSEKFLWCWFWFTSGSQVLNGGQYKPGPLMIKMISHYNHIFHIKILLSNFIHIERYDMNVTARKNTTLNIASELLKQATQNYGPPKISWDARLRESFLMRLQNSRNCTFHYEMPISNQIGCLIDKSYWMRKFNFTHKNWISWDLC